MSEVEFHVNEIVFDGLELPRHELGQFSATLNRALALVGQRLSERSPALLAELGDTALAAVMLEPEQLQRLLGPGGAAQLADLLMTNLFSDLAVGPTSGGE